MNNYAIVENGVVTNLVIWDGGEEWEPPPGATAVVIPADTFVSTGYTWNGTAFAAPASV
jgi:hypothetical protein